MTIGPILVLFLDYLVTKVTMVIDTIRFCFRIKLVSYIYAFRQYSRQNHSIMLTL